MHKQQEHKLLKEAIRVGRAYLQKRGVDGFESSDNLDFKVKAIYTLLVMDNLVQPLAKGEENLPNMKHKLALWISKILPPDHEALK